MTWTGDLFMDADSHVSHEEPRVRLARYLAKRFPPRDGFSAKRLSGVLRCTPKAADNILHAHWPNSRHWQRIVQHFGRDVVDAVFGPDINETVARLKREEADLERQLLEKRARRLQAEGFDPGRDERAEAAAVEIPAAVNEADELRSFAPQHRRR